MTRIDADRPCSQHHGQPRSQCDPWDRHVRTMRFRDDDWDSADSAAWAGRADVTTIATWAMEAMSGYLRCGKGRCHDEAPSVPVEFGDLTGRPLGEWIAEAVARIERQHPHHEPVMIGAEPASPAAPSAAPAAAKSVRFVAPKQASA